MAKPQIKFKTVLSSLTKGGKPCSSVGDEIWAEDGVIAGEAFVATDEFEQIPEGTKLTFTFSLGGETAECVTRILDV